MAIAVLGYTGNSSGGDATWTLKDTDGSILNTGTIASGDSADIVAPDATININGSLWGTVESGGTENIIVRQSTGSTQVGSKQGQYYRISDSNVSNSTLTYSVDVKAEDDLSLPDEDIIVTDENDNVLQTITNPVYDDLTIELTSFCPAPVGATLMKTGQTTSYLTGDDGDIEAGRATDFVTLASENPFGNLERFSGTNGSIFTFPGNTIIDWSTYNGTTVLGYGAYSNGGASGSNWDDAINDALAYSDGTFASGWRLPNIKEIQNIADFSNAYYPLDYYPFNITGVQFTNLWSSTTVASGTHQGWYFEATFGRTMYTAKTQTAIYSIPVREFTVNGTTLT